MNNTFKKRNETRYKNALLKEVDGLKALSKALEFQNEVFIPKIFHADEDVLHIEKINAFSQTKENSSILGKVLAQMHKKDYKQYGYYQNNYIGLNPQKNTLTNNWGNFFVEHRLGYQVSLIENSLLREHFDDILKTHSQKIENFLNQNTKHPSILHGDLWSGNVMYGTNKIYLIDPAVYYGDREVDLAMTEMFGGFGKEFYESYEKEYPCSKHYHNKKVMYNLYHYLNHYNLFGDGYLGGCEDGFKLIKTI